MSGSFRIKTFRRFLRKKIAGKGVRTPFRTHGTQNMRSKVSSSFFSLTILWQKLLCIKIWICLLILKTTEVFTFDRLLSQFQGFYLHFEDILEHRFWVFANSSLILKMATNLWEDMKCHKDDVQHIEYTSASFQQHGE